MKKLLSLMLVLAMMLTLVSGMALASEEDASAEPAEATAPEAEAAPVEDAAPVTDGEPAASGTIDTLTWSYEDGTLTISGEGAIPDYNAYQSQPWYDYDTQIKNIVVENGVTAIGDRAFMETAAVSVSLPDTVTSIGTKAFAYCTGLTELNIPAKVSTIGDVILADCSEDLVLYVTVGTAGHAYAVSGGFTYIDGTCGDDIIWYFNDKTGTLTLSGTGAIYDYPIKSGTTPSAPWYAVKDSITSVVIEDGITAIGTLAFYGCDMVTSVTLGKDVASIGPAAFARCTSLKELTVAYTVTDIDSEAFAYDYGLVLICARGTAAHSYAVNNDYDVTWRIVDCDHDYIGSVTTEPTCVETGIKTYVCSMCRDTYTEEVPVSDEHAWDDGVVTVPATAISEGEMLYTCTREGCGETYTDTIPMISVSYNGTGWTKVEGSWYYFKNSVMVTSQWVKYGGYWYYLKDTGVMAADEMLVIDGETYAFKASGVMKTGWQKIDNAWYYFAKSGEMYHDQWLKYNGYWYYLKSDGVMAAGEYVIYDHYAYYMYASGKMGPKYPVVGA